MSFTKEAKPSETYTKEAKPKNLIGFLLLESGDDLLWEDGTTALLEQAVYGTMWTKEAKT